MWRKTYRIFGKTWNDMYVRVRLFHFYSLKYTHITDWDTTFLGHKWNWSENRKCSQELLIFDFEIHHTKVHSLIPKFWNLVHVNNYEWSRFVNFPLRTLIFPSSCTPIHTYHNDEQYSTSSTAWVKALFFGFKACSISS